MKQIRSEKSKITTFLGDLRAENIRMGVWVGQSHFHVNSLTEKRTSRTGDILKKSYNNISEDVYLGLVPTILTR